jgi:hypothetical protein
MTTTTFDTLAYSKKLKAAGMPEQQADIQAEALFELVDEKLATKKDLELLKKDLIDNDKVHKEYILSGADTDINYYEVEFFNTLKKKWFI